MRAVLSGLLMLAAGAAAAFEPYPRVTAIEFSGNETTQAKVMQREMVIQVGDPADPEKIERSRQYIQDLGLFRWVRVTQVREGRGVRLTYAVQEKYYILPYPRLSANVEGQYSYGGELRMSNVAGLNHSLRILGERADLRESDRGLRDRYTINYSAPYLFDSPYRVGLGYSHFRSPVEEAEQLYEETSQAASFFVSRNFADEGGSPSQGSNFGAGLSWQDQAYRGAGAPPSFGQATALNLAYSYADFRNHVYSETGRAHGLSLSLAEEGIASDYSYQSVGAFYTRAVPWGETAHQTLDFSIAAGLYANGPGDVVAYSLGGSSQLRGYEVNSLEGNAYWLASLEFFRPVYRRSVRLGAILEVGGISADWQGGDFDKVYSSLGIGIRARFTRFVSFEVELGYAIPLDGSGGGKLFGGRV